MIHLPNMPRREFLAGVTATALALPLTGRLQAKDASKLQLNYMLPSSMYGYMDLEVILPEAEKIGATAIDIWPKVHGNQREQMEELGHDRVAELLKQHNVRLGCITQYPLGPFGLQKEMRVVQKFGGELMVCGGRGERGLTGSALKAEVGKFAELMKPHLEVAEETGVTIAIENHANNLIESPDSMKWLIELCPSPYLGIALAPYHLPQEEKSLAQLIRDLGNRTRMFYAWQHGEGSHKKMPKEDELKQMPGRGPLDFCPLIEALAEIRYDGWTEIFMHPFPRGIPILDTAEEVTAEINRARQYLSECR